MTTISKRIRFRKSRYTLARHAHAAIDTVPTDPDDKRVLECAVSAGSQTIVTGDDDLLRLVGFRGIEIVTVANFRTRFSGRGR